MHYSTRIFSATSSPLAWLGILLALLIILLSLPLTVPIGPMYWDTYLYLDASHRISSGQIPNVDFDTPVGPLGYYLFTWGLAVLSSAQPLLLAQWSLLAVAAPLLAIVLLEASKRSRALAYALLLPFIIFAVSPVNAQFYHSIPGVDGFGIYNRQAVLLLYVLTAGLLYLPDGRRLAFFCAATMLALLLTKVTGFLVGGILCLGALLARRISFANALLCVALFAFSLMILESASGIVSAYLNDIVQIATMNSSSLLSRFRTVVTNKFYIILPAALLGVVLLWIDLTRQHQSIRFFDRSTVWYGIAISGGVIFETQNTGSQEFIFIWPVLLMIFLRVQSLDERARLAFMILGAFCVVPTITNVVYKSVRVVAVTPIYSKVSAPSLLNIQQVSTREDIMHRAHVLDDHYARFPRAYQHLADHHQLPSWQYYWEIDNQMQWVVSANKMVEAFKKFERENGVKLESLMTLDFTDPFPWLLNRNATPHIQIGAVPARTLSEISPGAIAAVKATDGLLRPKCPVTWARDRIEKIYLEAIRDRKVVQLNPCWDLLVRSDFPLVSKRDEPDMPSSR